MLDSLINKAVRELDPKKPVGQKGENSIQQNLKLKLYMQLTILRYPFTILPLNIRLTFLWFADG